MLVCDESRTDVVCFDAGQPCKSPHRTPSDPGTASPEVRDAMLATIPSLRAFALSLTNNRDAADDLVQDTILRAWANIDRFEAGTNLNAWLFTILRNGFYTQYRRKRREVEDPDEALAGSPCGTPSDTSGSERQVRCPGHAQSAGKALT